MDTTSFWAVVSNYMDAAGNKIVSALASFALSLLSLPCTMVQEPDFFA